MGGREKGSGLGVSRSGCLSPLECGRSRSDVVKELRDLSLHQGIAGGVTHQIPLEHELRISRRRDRTPILDYSYSIRVVTEKRQGRCSFQSHRDDALVKSGLPSQCQQTVGPLEASPRITSADQQKANPEPESTKIISPVKGPIPSSSKPHDDQHPFPRQTRSKRVGSVPTKILTSPADNRRNPTPQPTLLFLFQLPSNPDDQLSDQKKRFPSSQKLLLLHN